MGPLLSEAIVGGPQACLDTSAEDQIAIVGPVPWSTLLPTASKSHVSVR